jgi:addiction module HigA family antidote
MIQSFKDRETERIFRRERSRKFPPDLQDRAFVKLNALDAATRDLRLPPSNRLEALRGGRMKSERIVPVHPGFYLRELVEELAFAPAQMAEAIQVPPETIQAVLEEKQAVSAEMAYRLGLFFGQTPCYWLNLQSRYDMDLVEDTLGTWLKRTIKPLKAA